MKTSESIKEIIPALFSACENMGGVKKNARNPYYESDYANINSFIDVIDTPLRENGLLLLQPIGKNENGTFVETVIFHSSTQEWVSSETPVLCNNTDPQKQGSGITYARRYGIQSMLRLLAVDDDGNKAKEKNRPKQNLIKLETVKKIKAELDKAIDTPLAWESVRGDIDVVENIPVDKVKVIADSIVEYLKNENS